MSEAKLSRIRWCILAAMTAANIVIWSLPYDVLRLVAREKEVLLGRYSEVRFIWMLALGGLSLVALFVLLPKTHAARKKRGFAVVAAVMGAIPVLIAADLVLRLLTVYPYVSDKTVYHRPSNWRIEDDYNDVPRFQRSYPIVRPGYGCVHCVMSYDANGFRNTSVPQTCDVVTLGDSFTEGSRVDDAEAWPAVLAKETKLRVYNTGISGYSPAEYLAALEAFGLPLKPNCVVCMLYEGNDFRTDTMVAKSGVSLEAFIKTSPILMGLDRFLTGTFGPLGGRGAFPGSDVLDWLPLRIPNDDHAHFYGFAPKQLIELAVDQEDFASSGPWQAVQKLLAKMHDECSSVGARLVIAYAPNKAHTVLPLAVSWLPAAKLRSFVGLRMHGQLPEPDAFEKMLLGKLDNRQKVIERWCRENDLMFVSLTDELRKRALAGEQVFYTYDQHWTPAGHAAAADVVAHALGSISFERRNSAKVNQGANPNPHA